MTQARTMANHQCQTSMAQQDGVRRKFEPRYVQSPLPANLAVHMDPFMFPQRHLCVTENRSYPKVPIAAPRPGVQPQKRQPLTSLFPFNQCTDIHLRETRKSLEQGLRSAVQHYSRYDFQMYHLSGNSLFENGDSLPNKELFYFEHEPLPNSKIRQLLALPPILVRNSEPDRDHVVQLLKKALHACLKKKMNISETSMADPMVQHSLHYATNLFLQGFKSPSTKVLCDDIIRDNHSGELNDALSDLVGDFLDKYEETALDSYEDALIEGVTKTHAVMGSRTVENPNFVADFQNIWKLDPPNFFEFDVRVYIEEFSATDNRPYSYNTYWESYIAKLGEVGMTMNILKATLNYRDELLRKPPPEVVQQNIVDMAEFSELQQSLLDILETVTDSPPAKPKTKSLRFADA